MLAAAKTITKKSITLFSTPLFIRIFSFLSLFAFFYHLNGFIVSNIYFKKIN